MIDFMRMLFHNARSPVEFYSLDSAYGEAFYVRENGEMSEEKPKLALVPDPNLVNRGNVRIRILQRGSEKVYQLSVPFHPLVSLTYENFRDLIGAGNQMLEDQES